MMEKIFISVFVMAFTTYLLRMLPIALLQKKIHNTFLKSFLAYIPYAVLATMTFPAILYATSSVLSAAVGLIVCITLAYLGKGLLTVAISGTIAVYLVETILRTI